MRCLRRPPSSSAPFPAGLAAPSFTAAAAPDAAAPDAAAPDAAAAVLKLAMPAVATALVFPLPSPLSLRFEKWLSSIDAFAKRVPCVLCKSGKLFVIFTTV